MQNIENIEDYAEIYLIANEEQEKIGGWDDTVSSGREYGIVEIKSVIDNSESEIDIIAPVVSKLNLSFNSEKIGFDVSAAASDDNSGIDKITIGIQNPIDASLSKFDLVFNNDSSSPLYEYFFPLVSLLTLLVNISIHQFLLLRLIHSLPFLNQNLIFLKSLMIVL